MSKSSKVLRCADQATSKVIITSRCPICREGENHKNLKVCEDCKKYLYDR